MQRLLELSLMSPEETLASKLTGLVGKKESSKSVAPKLRAKDIPTKELPDGIIPYKNFEVHLSGVSPGVKMIEYEQNRRTNIFNVRSSIAGGRY